MDIRKEVESLGNHHNQFISKVYEDIVGECLACVRYTAKNSLNRWCTFSIPPWKPGNYDLTTARNILIREMSKNGFEVYIKNQTTLFISWISANDEPIPQKPSRSPQKHKPIEIIQRKIDLDLFKPTLPNIPKKTFDVEKFYSAIANPSKLDYLSTT